MCNCCISNQHSTPFFAREGEILSVYLASTLSWLVRLYYIKVNHTLSTWYTSDLVYQSLWGLCIARGYGCWPEFHLKVDILPTRIFALFWHTTPLIVSKPTVHLSSAVFLDLVVFLHENFFFTQAASYVALLLGGGKTITQAHNACQHITPPPPLQGGRYQCASIVGRISFYSQLACIDKPGGRLLCQRRGILSVWAASTLTWLLTPY
jgi:hypothetical protein